MRRISATRVDDEAVGPGACADSFHAVPKVYASSAKLLSAEMNGKERHPKPIS